MPDRPEVEIRDLRRDPHSSLARRFYENVLRPSFQADELDSWESFEHGLRSDDDPVLRAVVAVDRDGDPLGGLTAELYSPVGVLLLGYLAVRPDWRGRGIGTLLMTTAATDWYADPTVVLAVGEVHDPRHRWDGAGEDSLARLRFFQGFGARVLRVAFVQPSLGPGRRRVPHFLLVVFAVKEPALLTSVPPAVDGRRVESFVRRYYATSEGPLSAEPDAELARLLTDLAVSPGVAILPIDRYEEVPVG